MTNISNPWVLQEIMKQNTNHKDTNIMAKAEFLSTVRLWTAVKPLEKHKNIKLWWERKSN